MIGAAIVLCSTGNRIQTSRRNRLSRSVPCVLLFLCVVFGCDGSRSGSSPEAATSDEGASSQLPAPGQTAEQSHATNADGSPGSPGNVPGGRAETDVASSAVPFVAPSLKEDEIRAGWISLFDGVSLFGWEVPSQTNWHVDDGSIVADQGERSLLLTPFRFDDFEFRCEFHLAAGGNSGIFLRTTKNPADPVTDAYELNICDSHPTHRTGSLVGRLATENIPPSEDAWHAFLVRCEGPRIQVWMDGQPIVDFTDTTPGLRLQGHIGLQMNGGRIAFRNVYLRPVNPVQLFSGTDLTGWQAVPGSKSEFDVSEAELRLTGGPGFLQSAGTYGDMILQLEARTNRELVNSGVFFRTMPGTAETPSNGYELQIQNGIKSGDRTQPVDGGTGAIFRRAAARYVVSDDREWFTQTLIAQQNQFAAWVNGYQVVSWRDDRDENPNPRKGMRLEPGHISLQGHDELTDVSFRSIRIHQLPPADAAAKE